MKFDIDTINKAIDKYGVTIQTTVMVEECGELIQQLAKMVRGIGDEDYLIEEVADVYICLETVREMYGIEDEALQNAIDFKQNRMKERMKNG